MGPLLIAVILVGCTFIYVLLFGPTRYHRNGMVGRLHVMLTTNVPRMMLRVARRMLGARTVDRIVNSTQFLLFARHPLLQFFYITLITGGVFIFFRDVWHYMYNATYTSPVHIVTAPLAIAATYAMFWLACIVDPGFISRKNVDAAIANYPYDHVVFTPRECPTCKLPKPARSKHCSLCNRCVDRHDHHCAWINSCVGSNNIKYFIGFLATSAFLCFYGFFIFSYILWSIVDERKLFSLYRLDRVNNTRAPVTWLDVFAYLFMTERNFLTLTVFLLLVGLLQAVFLLYSMSFIVVNVTAHEEGKWAEVRARLNDGEVLKVPRDVARQHHNNVTEFTATRMPKNIYSRGGWWANIVDVLIRPRTVVR